MVLYVAAMGSLAAAGEQISDHLPVEKSVQPRWRGNSLHSRSVRYYNISSVETVAGIHMVFCGRSVYGDDVFRIAA